MTSEQIKKVNKMVMMFLAGIHRVIGRGLSAEKSVSEYAQTLKEEARGSNSFWLMVVAMVNLHAPLQMTVPLGGNRYLWVQVSEEMREAVTRFAQEQLFGLTESGGS